ncbi:hypothetical protein ACF09C_00470 [Streptomyces sp. NPDC014870]|uniref:hypothetical protein n=1 Tax=Streptomyces sp. NPDC014870 TaxID=3364925 RepID=UPI0036FE7CAA
MLQHPHRDVLSSAARGWAFLSASPHGMPAALCSCDPSFDPSLEEIAPPAAAPRLLRERDATDLGFELGDEAFSAMLALSVLPRAAAPAERRFLGDVARQVEGARRGSRFAFFPGVPAFAADTDCTAVAAGALIEHGLMPESRFLATVQDLLRSAVGPGSGTPNGPLHEGVFLVYWDDSTEPDAPPRGPKHDAVACANVLATLHLVTGHPDAAPATLAYLRHHLTSGDYRKGTRYYPSPAAFLHAAARVCRRCARCADALSAPLAAALNHVEPESALDLALLTIAADDIGLGSPPAWREELAARQRQDGSWPAHGYFRMGRVPLWFGSPHLTTVFAVRALHGARP